jgi:hypothetical protein
LENKIKIGKRHKRDTKYTLETQAITLSTISWSHILAFSLQTPPLQMQLKRKRRKSQRKDHFTLFNIILLGKLTPYSFVGIEIVEIN